MFKIIKKFPTAVNAIPLQAWGVGLVAALGWVVTLTFGWVWDDFPTFVNNLHLQNWSTVWRGFLHDFWSLHETPELSGYWRPLPTALYVLFTQLFGTSTVAFHSLNVVCHMGVSVAGTVLLWKLGLAGLGLWGAGIFFALHPLHAETVSFVSASPDLLAAGFGLLALLYALKGQTKLNWWLAAFWFSMALLSKESALIFPLVWLFLERGPKKRKALVFGVAMAMSIIYLGLHVGVTQGIGARELWGGRLDTHLGTVVRLLPFSIFLSLFPVGTTPTRVFPISSGFSDPWSWFALVSVLVAGLWVWNFRHRRRFLVTGTGIFLLFWLPVSNLIPAEGLIADRYLYLPVLGTTFLWGSLVSLIGNQKLKVGMVILLALSWGSWAYVNARPWKSERSLWGHAIQASPDSAVAWNHWGKIVLAEGKWDEAEKAFGHALTLQPHHREAQLNLVMLFYEKGDAPQALIEARKYLAKHPEDPRAWDLLAAIWSALGDKKAALQSAQTAVRLAPMQWKYHFNLGVALMERASFDQAAISLTEAFRISPNHPQILMNLAATYYLQGEFENAAGVYRNLLQKWPQHEKARENLLRTEEKIRLLSPN